MPTAPAGVETTTINLGHKGSRIMPEKAEEKVFYPSLYVSDLPSDSPLLDGKIGEEFTALVTFKRSGIRKDSVDLDAMKMDVYT